MGTEKAINFFHNLDTKLGQEIPVERKKIIAQSHVLQIRETHCRCVVFERKKMTKFLEEKVVECQCDLETKLVFIPLSIQSVHLLNVAMHYFRP